MKPSQRAPRALPERPDLDHLKREARDLLRQAQAEDAAALSRFRDRHPKLGTGKVSGASLTLSDAQLVIAREYGFRSWPKLRSHVVRVLGGAPKHDSDTVQAQIGARLRRLSRVDGSVSARDLRRLEAPQEPGALLLLALPYCDVGAREGLLASGDLRAVVAALDAVIGRREPEPVGARATTGDDAADAAACLAVLHCGGFPHLLGRRFPLTAERVTLGRNLERDLAFNDDSVSRLHCTIERTDAGFVLRDERSTNGTFVASSGTFVNQMPEPVTEHVLSDGDQFAIGDVILAFIAADIEAGGSPDARRASMERKCRDAVEYIARHDALTRLYNRRTFDAEVGREVLLARAADRPLSALLLDVDGFKQHNERLGHLAGNGLLLRLAQVLRQELGDDAVVGRYAGDEYAVLLPGVELDAAREVAERLRGAVEARPVELGGERIQATASAGVATLYRTTGAEELMADARAALRRAKEAGRNTVRTAA